MAQELQPGEHVSWNYGAGQAKGQVVEKLTENKKLGSRVFKATPEDPKYLVKSDTSGKEAIKKPETLHKFDDDSAGQVDDSNTSTDSKEGALKESTTRSSGESNENREEGGAKEKRDEFRQRSAKEELKELDNEESAKKVPDRGAGSVRESAKAAEGKTKPVLVYPEESGVADDEGEQEDREFEAEKYEQEAADEDDEVPAEIPEKEVVKVGEEAK